MHSCIMHSWRAPVPWWHGFIATGVGGVIGYGVVIVMKLGFGIAMSVGVDGTVGFAGFIGFLIYEVCLMYLCIDTKILINY